VKPYEYLIFVIVLIGFAYIVYRWLSRGSAAEPE
jgi:hypothetical protein